MDWIEFKSKKGNKILLRPEYISSICDNWNGSCCVMMGYDEHMIIDDDAKTGSFVLVNEPYKQVKQKIMDAEKVDLNDVVVEHFTRDEYESLEACVGYYAEYGEIDHGTQIELSNLQYKLNEILKEDK